MKSYTFKAIKGYTVTIFTVFLIFSTIFIACKEEEVDPGAPFFNIEGAPTGLSVPVKGITQSYVVRSNRPWQIVPKEENDWIKVFPDEGEDDGIFKFIVSENISFDPRTVNFAFIVDGKEQPVLFRIEQEENVPFIIIDGAEEGKVIPAVGGEILVNVNANVEWDYSLDDDNWISAHEKTGSGVKISAPQNFGPRRSLTLTITAQDEPDLSAEIEIAQSSGSVIIEENFNWLAYGNAIPYETSGEKRYDAWTQEEKDRGWYSTPVDVSNGEQLCYARQGFVKLGKTNYGGDLISPKFGLDGTATVKVTFKAAGYISAGGAIDDKILKIIILGGGESSVSEFIIDNIPNSRAQDDAGIENNIWDPARAYSFTITGATAETQVKFLGNDYDLRTIGQGKNRIFLDDIKVEIIELN